MGKNSKLRAADKAQNDEFYTQYADIQMEVNAYLEYNPDVFRGKTILLPCDDPEWSNFTRFFAENFEFFGLKKLISTSFAVESKNSKWYEPTQGDGDFRSKEVCALRDEADVIITNPPFSLFREFVAWIMEANKQFLIIGNQNALTYKEIFPLIKANRMWTGCRFNRRVNGDNMTFMVPDDYPMKGTELYVEDGKKYISVAGTGWFTNIDHGRRHQPLQLMTMSDNIKYSKHKEVKDIGYVKYDNYDALEVPFSDAIPSDYTEPMGVPISFMSKFCRVLDNERTKKEGKYLSMVDGQPKFFRIIIRKKQ